MKTEEQTDYDWKSSSVYKLILVITWTEDERVESVQQLQICCIMCFCIDIFVYGCSLQYLLFCHFI